MTFIDRARALPRRVNTAIDGWLTAPEANAAGRMGLFRIVYALFYLWHVSRFNFIDMGRSGRATWRPIQIDRFVREIPSVGLRQELVCLLVFALLLLLVGYRVRLATLLILVTGSMLEAIGYSFGKVGHDTLFLCFYIPLFMLIGRWGAAYSLDAALTARRTGGRVAATESSWQWIWPMRAVLLTLSALFLTAAYWKMTHGTWESNPSTLLNLLVSTALGSVVDGRTMSPIIPALVRVPLLTTLMQAGTLAFESLFFLSLFNRWLRNWFLALAIIFHGANLVLLHVSFTPQIIVYLLFVDWQALYARWVAPYIPHLSIERFPAPVWVIGVPSAAFLLGLLWISTPALRLIPSLGGLVNTNTLWIAIVPIAIIVWLRHSVILLRDLLARRPSATSV